MTDHSLCGWRVRSELPLHELAPWTGDDRPPDILIALGTVSDRLENPLHQGPFLQVGQDGTCQLNVVGVARYRVSAGRSVTIEPLGPATAPDINVFLLGSVLGILCHQRDLVPLHASVVRIGQTAVAFAGLSGSGKSTMAAALARRGHMVLADDVAAIDASALGRPVFWPSFPRLKLWKDSLQVLSIDPAGLQRTRQAQDKFHLPVQAFDPAAVPLSAVYGLVTARGPRQPGIEKQAGRHAVALLSAQIYRGIFGRLLGRQAALFTAICQVAQSTAIETLIRPDDLPNLDDVARQVEDHAAAMVR